MTKKEIDNKYMQQAEALEEEFFSLVVEIKGLKILGQHRKLKTGKSEADFNVQHGNIWKAHDAELIAKGFRQPPQPIVPQRNLAAEMDDLESRIKKLEDT